MSTKIYNGLRIKYMTMQELIPFSKELRAQLEPIAKEEFLKSYTKMLEEARSIFPNTDLAAEGMVFDVTSRVVP